MQTKLPGPQIPGIPPSFCFLLFPLARTITALATGVQLQPPFPQGHDAEAAPDAVPALIQFATSSFAGTRPAHIILPLIATAGTDKMPAAIMAFKSVTFSTTAITPVSCTAAATTFSTSWHLAHPGPNTLISILLPFPNNKLKQKPSQIVIFEIHLHAPSGYSSISDNTFPYPITPTLE